MMERLKRKFTNWYIKKGYLFGYDYSQCEDIDGIPFGDLKTYVRCPIWVRWLAVYLFSPSMYMYEKVNLLSQAFCEGFESGWTIGIDLSENLIESVKIVQENGERAYASIKINLPKDESEVK